jgi:Protein of unknown function (DUF2934)
MISQHQKKTAAVIPSDRIEHSPSYADQWQQQVALRAYLKAEARGFAAGHELDDWLEAERELAAESVDEVLAA